MSLFIKLILQTETVFRQKMKRYPHFLTRVVNFA